MSSYDPKPIDGSALALEPHHRALIEALTEHVHDVWARKRLDEGWRYGPKRDDDAKHHPGLVAFDALSAGEQDYDREIVEQVIRGALAKGYRITPPER